MEATQMILPVRESEIERFKKTIKENILDGNLNPLAFYRDIKLMEKCIEELKKDGEIMECAFTELDKYGKEKAVFNGSVIDTGSKTTYDYKACEDPVWNELNEKIKAREKLLKALPPEGMVDPETGMFIKPPSAKISNFITVKI